jgi:hypothetical protein
MNSESNTPETTAIVEVHPETEAIVKQETKDKAEAAREETEALIEAIKKRAQAELQSAGEFTLDAYLNAVRQARVAIEQNQLFNSAQIEQSIEFIQREAEKNWSVITGEIESLGVRLADAARLAWDRLMASRKE